MSVSTLLIRNQTDTSLQNWREQEKLALELLTIVGALRFDKAIELTLFQRNIYDTSTTTLLNNHLYAKRYTDKEVTVEISLSIAKIIDGIDDLRPCKVDIGKIAVEWLANNHAFKNLDALVIARLQGFVNVPNKNEAAKDVVLYGFGRIGRLVARRLIMETGKGDQLRLKAIVIRPKMDDRFEEAKKRAALLQSDSVHGDFDGIIEVAKDGSELTVNGNKIQLIFAKQPTDIDYSKYGIKDALVIDNTGAWRDRDGLNQHLRPGVEKVLLTAPGKGDIANIVYGVNHETVNIEKENVYSAASCTTNAIAPVLKVISDNLGIEKGHIETIHSYTNDQNLLDNFHKKPRRGRGAPINMVLTTTGAASAVTKVLPEFAGKLTGNAIRVPTPNVSLAILNLTLNQSTTVEQLNNLLKDAAFHSHLFEQIHYSDSTEYVSSNAIGMTTTSVVDIPSTILSKDGKTATIYLWYDNEYGYTCQVIRLAKHIAKVKRYVYF